MSAVAGGPDSGAEQGALRRVFLHALALLGVFVAASGLATLVRVALQPLGATVIERDTDAAVAFGLALTIVGLPVWLAPWVATRRVALGSADERRALPRRLYLVVVRAVTLGIAVGAAIVVGRWLVGVNDFDARALSWLLVWGGTWAYHERVAAEVPLGSQGTRRLDRLVVYVIAAVGFGMLAGALGAGLARSLGEVYRQLVPADLLVGRPGLGIDLRSTAVVAVVGGLVWWWHWGVLGRRDAGSTGWLVYVFLVGVLSGTVAALSGASVLVHRVLAWILRATEGPAGEHFEAVPAALAALLVGVAAWGYHGAVLREREEPRQTGWSGPERTYRYLITAAGLGTAAGGLATLLALGFDLAVPGRTLVGAPRGIRDVVAVGLTLLLVGVPVWARAWSGVQRRAREHPDERSALPRRVLIFGAFGAATLTAVITLSALLYRLFQSILEGALSADLLEEQRWALAVVLTAAAVSVHYWLVLREDRQAAPPPADAEAVTLREVVLVTPDPDGLAAELRDRLGVPITAWRSRTAGGAAAALDADLLEQRLRAVASPRALVVDVSGTALVVPLHD